MLEYISIFHCFLLTNVAIPHFVYHSSIGGHLDYFHFLTPMNKAAMIISIHVFMWIFVFISLGYIYI